jgi:hypothetical protein
LLLVKNKVAEVVVSICPSRTIVVEHCAWFDGDIMQTEIAMHKHAVA